MKDKFTRAKIVCTIGPASAQPEIIEAMAEAGMDVARVNLSHGDCNFHRTVFDSLRNIGEVATMVDLPGPKIRVGEIDGSITLRQGQNIRFTTRRITGDRDKIPVTYDNLPREVSPGESIFLNDGFIEVKVVDVDRDLKGFVGNVVSGGEITSNKGVNAPSARLSMRPPTEKDLRGIDFGVEIADWFAVSFVRDSSDVYNTRKAVEEAGGDQPIVSKIEHRGALDNIDEIIGASDGVMVARGDLGVEVPPWEVPLLQKNIISKCNTAGKPVIVATQMLESMTVNPRPTRAEASDVTNAILDGADAVMLSGETAVGLFPLESVRTMNNLILTVEEKAPVKAVEPIRTGVSIADVIGSLASRAAEVVKPAAVIVVTRSGFSARMVSKHRPKTRILSVAKSVKVNRRTRLYWGVIPLDVAWTEDRDELLIEAMKTSLKKELVDEKDAVMIVSGSSLEAPGRTSAFEILKVEDVLCHASNPR